MSTPSFPEIQAGGTVHVYFSAAGRIYALRLVPCGPLVLPDMRHLLQVCSSVLLHGGLELDIKPPDYSSLKFPLSLPEF
jgi:hypothetical protein